MDTNRYWQLHHRSSNTFGKIWVDRFSSKLSALEAATIYERLQWETFVVCPADDIVYWALGFDRLMYRV